MTTDIESIMQAERKRPPTFEQVHPFRVPLPDDCHVRFTELTTAADSAVWYKSYMVDETTGRTYDNAACLEIHNARRYPARQETLDCRRARLAEQATAERGGCR